MLSEQENRTIEKRSTWGASIKDHINTAAEFSMSATGAFRNARDLALKLAFRAWAPLRDQEERVSSCRDVSYTLRCDSTVPVGITVGRDDGEGSEPLNSRMSSVDESFDVDSLSSDTYHSAKTEINPDDNSDEAATSTHHDHKAEPTAGITYHPSTGVAPIDFSYRVMSDEKTYILRGNFHIQLTDKMSMITRRIIPSLRFVSDCEGQPTVHVNHFENLDGTELEEGLQSSATEHFLDVVDDNAKWKKFKDSAKTGDIMSAMSIWGEALVGWAEWRKTLWEERGWGVRIVGVTDGDDEKVAKEACVIVDAHKPADDGQSSPHLVPNSSGRLQARTERVDSVANGSEYGSHPWSMCNDKRDHTPRPRTSSIVSDRDVSGTAGKSTRRDRGRAAMGIHSGYNTA